MQDKAEARIDQLQMMVEERDKALKTEMEGRKKAEGALAKAVDALRDCRNWYTNDSPQQKELIEFFLSGKEF